LSDLPPEIVGPRGAQRAEPATAPAEAGERDGASAPDDPAGLARALFRWARQDAERRVLPAVERELVVQALQETGGNQVRAAKLLGITRATLRKRIAKYQIQRGVSVR
jgi:two-component system nitrogen regulation response regulator GlnG